MTHDDPAHLSTAHRAADRPPRPDAQLRRRRPVAQRLAAPGGARRARCRPTRGALPSAVTMPWTVAHPAAPGGKAPGQHGGWLGKAFDPFRVEGDPNAPDFQVAGLGLPDGRRPPSGCATAARCSPRPRTRTDLPAPARAWDGYPGPGARRPGLGRGPGRLPDRPRRPAAPRPLRPAHPRPVPAAGPPAGRGGRRPGDGQLARRRPELLGHPRRQLQPPQEPPDAPGRPGLRRPARRPGRPRAARRDAGRLGRRVRPARRGSPPANAGREHWPRCYSAVLAGGGVRGGQVYGASDRWAAYPARDPVSPDDLGATILHALGIDPGQQVRDPLGRRCASTWAGPYRTCSVESLDSDLGFSCQHRIGPGSVRRQCRRHAPGFGSQPQTRLLL